MKLSDAIILGSTMFKMAPGNWGTCALGVAASAVGIPKCESRFDRICEEWPWLEDRGRLGLIRISRMYDQHVYMGSKTLEDLVSYVRQIEPKCECATRGCCCDRLPTEPLAINADSPAVDTPQSLVGL